MKGFDGFPHDCIPFMEELARNNNRDWFNDNKQRYESLVREPALMFIEGMADGLKKISPHFTAIAKKSGGSLMRVYRDTRFSKDKIPYKTNIGIQFRHELGKNVHAPGFYVHIAADECFIGVGIWHPESDALKAIREFILDNPSSWNDSMQYPPFRRNFKMVGESLKRPPRGIPADHELIEDLKRKDFIALKSFDAKKINDKKFIKFVLSSFDQADPFMHYLCDAVEVQYREV
jgi:uncharacterized protein (TIGR02453 family)